MVGSTWSLVEHLHRTSFYAARPPRKEMRGAIQSALKNDIKYELPQNYQDGAGDTYFSGTFCASCVLFYYLTSISCISCSPLFQH